MLTDTYGRSAHGKPPGYATDSDTRLIFKQYLLKNIFYIKRNSASYPLKQTRNAAFVRDIYVLCRRMLRKTRHGHYISRQHHRKASAG